MISIMETKHDNLVNSLPGAPLYQQIKEKLIISLIEKKWLAGEMIPSEVELADIYSVSQGTVRKAIDELVAEKLLTRKQGKGTFVASHQEERSNYRFLRLVNSQGNFDQSETKILLCHRLKSPQEVCSKLKISNDEVVIHLRRLMSFYRQPVVLEDIWLPSKKFDGLTHEMLLQWGGSLYALFEKQFGIHMVRADEQIKAVKANALAEEFLKVEISDPLLEITRISYTYDNLAVEMRQALYLTKDYYYFNELN